MILNVVLVIKLCWDVNLFDQIVSLVRVGQQGLQSSIYV